MLSVGVRRSSWQIQRAVIYALLVRELKGRVGGRAIGIFWLLFEPAANIAVLLYVRGVLIERQVGATIEWVTYHVVAMISYFVFRGCWMRGMASITSNSGLFSYRQVKPIDALISRSLVEVLVYGIVFVIILSGLGWLGFHFIPDNPLMFFWSVFLFWALGTAWGLISAVLTHGRPNAQTFVRLTSFPMYMLSGVILPLKSFPPDVLEILMYNPAAQLVEMCRSAYFENYRPVMFYDPHYPVLVAIVSMGIGLILYHLNRMKLMRKG